MFDRILFGKCPLCDCQSLTDSVIGNCSRHPLFHSSLSAEMRWKKCARCAHIFTEGYYTEAACKLIFSKTNENQRLGADMERQRMASSHMIEKVLPYAATGHWLDVGFGNGSLLFTAQEYGFEPMGIDLRTENVAGLSALGIESHCVDIAALALTFQLSVISMADVLEHIPYPRNALRSARQLLSSAGVLFLSMPNMESMLWRAMDRSNANPYWGEIEHYHNFSRTRLYALLRETGFEPVRYGVSERYRACMEVIARKS